ncbi:adhesion protein [Marinilactibacillus sp. 15R]|uniref:Adhesion protein n=1 Tax=Marinilactibacillus piezotolerans TaxID=258723 RepID=A0A1I3ZZG8_9LACT|nr:MULTISPECIES: adhesion protein [Marinilactibacillus]API90096.1 adhesion protein [Marinilactibacillus sp. 15R]SFK49433.1 hypothetical protein SAMN04488569_104117 [Marinilactibacillus piezotolerans]
METILFIIVMIIGHLLMMYLMPGMHGGHSHKKVSDADNSLLEKEILEEKNRKLKEELHELKSRVGHKER